MIFEVFAVRDAKAKAYLPPNFLPQAGQAIRSFSDAVLDTGSAFNKHPEDYSLFRIATFNDESGHFEVCEPECLITGAEVDAADKKQNQQ